MKLIAICVFGIEAVLAREIKDLGLIVDNTRNGRVEFQGGIEEVAKCNIHLRTAERVYIQAVEFPAHTFDELFDGAYKVNWDEFISPNGRINVRASSINSKLFSQRDCQRIVKKSIASKMCETNGLRLLSEDGPEYKVEIFIHNDNAEINLDTTGIGLHKRGYRTLNVEAPLKETIAAALLEISYWKPGRILLDPFCGSGTFPIEAAMMSAGIAPGIKRHFLFETWNKENRNVTDKVRELAESKIKIPNSRIIYGSDISRENIKIALKHADAAGVESMIKFQVHDAVTLKPQDDYGIMICNPPYGLRLSDKEEVEGLHRGIGELFSRFGTWSKYVLTDSREFERESGIKANKRRKIYNGTISCTFYQYFGPKPLYSRDSDLMKP